MKVGGWGSVYVRRQGQQGGVYEDESDLGWQGNGAGRGGEDECDDDEACYASSFAHSAGPAQLLPGTQPMLAFAGRLAQLRVRFT